jgi:hypothetical protein
MKIGNHHGVRNRLGKLFQPPSARTSRGDILMEYIILLVCIVLPLVAFSGAMFNPAGDYQNNFGAVGNAFHDAYQHIVSGVSQPVP